MRGACGSLDKPAIALKKDSRAEFVESVKHALVRLKFAAAELDGKKVRQLLQQRFKFVLPEKQG
jgi:hypothetical protein